MSDEEQVKQRLELLQGMAAAQQKVETNEDLRLRQKFIRALKSFAKVEKAQVPETDPEPEWVI
jgi:hypothetical protein